MNSRLLFTIICTFLGLQFSQAQYIGQPLNTDRPGFTYTPMTVGQGIWQWESGFEYNRRDTENFGDVRSWGLNGHLRYGVLETLEVMVSLYWTDFKTFISDSSFVQAGLNTPEVALRWNILDGESGPSLGLFANVGFSTLSSKDFESNEISSNVIGTFSIPVGERSSIGSNAGLTFFKESEESIFRATLNYSYAVSDYISVYGEWFGRFSEFTESNIIDGGVVLNFNSNLMADFEIGFDVSGNDTPFYILGGFGYRFGKRVY